MYRQIRIHDDDKKFQRIIWRKHPTDSLQTYDLTTDTYGTASAPFAATRTLNQLAADEGSKFPLAAAIVVKDFYVDDVLSGGESVNEIQTAAEQLTQLLDSGGFQLHKWCSNSAEFLESIPDELREKQSTLEISGANDVIKTLGLLWNPSSDELAFRINPIQTQTAITKRHILSEMSKIYDPLGLLAPATLVSKLLMRELWKLKIDWDEEVPIEQRNNWVNFIASLIATAGMTINRYVLTDNRIAIELHAYSDASLAAYGTCVYIRSICSNGNAEVHLLTSKSKVAPNQTVPRLELCAFLLMSRLVKVVTSALKLDFNNIVLWTDSQIVLCWLKKSPHELNTFVANRVAEIQRSTKGYEFKYIRSALNPADMVSRGVLPGELMHNDVWWHGPSFSRTATYKEFVFTEEILIPDVKTIALPVSCQSIDFPVLERYSSFHKLRRVMAYVARFIRKTKGIRTANDNEVFPTVEEYQVSLDMIVSLVQRQYYAEDIKQIQRYNTTQNMDHKYVGDSRSLNPIHESGILRVGGRIKHANLTFGQRHPIILPPKHHVTKIIINDFHETYLHIGPSGLLSALRQRFWIVDGRNVIQKHLKGCIRCFKTNPPEIKRYMGDLPKFRVTQSDVFSRVGVDYGGPFHV
ncbi:uncharacterized protein LOC131680690 [Topomyia yanbarensis]|uniref:uncharacterized protein LOC131680690 n=1 Tax=Topomyia yanbarensis TaxID=2498891 RepID=UPI00273CDB6F|nr:uncharacterized protein LOC131680690 [Topomyia yanbarensis]